VKSLLVGQNISRDGFDDFFVNVRQVSTGFRN
jgi:hypothetical protein